MAEIDKLEVGMRFQTPNKTIYRINRIENDTVCFSWFSKSTNLRGSNGISYGSFLSWAQMEAIKQVRLLTNKDIVKCEPAM